MNHIEKNLQQAEQLITGSKLKKFLAIPVKYVFSFIYRQLIFRFTKASLQLKCGMITGDDLHILFPSGNDVFLFGCKSHPSEIRLTRFLLRNIKEGNVFIDAGAHFGFYSMLAARLAGATGRVFSFEPARKTFEILKKNTAAIPSISIFNRAVYKENTTLKFYEYPVLQSEYNTAKPLEHLSGYEAVAVEVEAVSVDNTIPQTDMSKKAFVKIDVEGSEYDVLQGMKGLIQAQKPLIIIEYFEKYPTRNYQDCLIFLTAEKYAAYTIDETGSLQPVKLNPQVTAEIDNTSDNIVFSFAG